MFRDDHMARNIIERGRLVVCDEDYQRLAQLFFRIKLIQAGLAQPFLVIFRLINPENIHSQKGCRLRLDKHFAVGIHQTTPPVRQFILDRMRRIGRSREFCRYDFRNRFERTIDQLHFPCLRTHTEQDRRILLPVNLDRFDIISLGRKPTPVKINQILLLILADACKALENMRWPRRTGLRNPIPVPVDQVISIHVFHIGNNIFLSERKRPIENTGYHAFAVGGEIPVFPGRILPGFKKRQFIRLAENGANSQQDETDR